jgi:hypothetical protein
MERQPAADLRIPTRQPARNGNVDAVYAEKEINATREFLPMMSLSQTIVFNSCYCAPTTCFLAPINKMLGLIRVVKYMVLVRRDNP